MTTEIKTIIKEAARKHLPGYDCRLIAAQMKQESAFNPVAVSPAGAMGLMQIMPPTWQELTEDEPSTSRHAEFSPNINTHMGCKYMAQMLKGWTAPRPEIDRICLALASYNAGFGHLLKAQEVAGGANDYASIIAALPKVTGRYSEETTQYVQRIFNFYNHYITKGW